MVLLIPFEIFKVPVSHIINYSENYTGRKPLIFTQHGSCKIKKINKQQLASSMSFIKHF